MRLQQEQMAELLDLLQRLQLSLGLLGADWPDHAFDGHGKAAGRLALPYLGETTRPDLLDELVSLDRFLTTDRPHLGFGGFFRSFPNRGRRRAGNFGLRRRDLRDDVSHLVHGKFFYFRKLRRETEAVVGEGRPVAV